MSSDIEPEIAQIPLDIQKVVVSCLNIYQIGKLRITNKVNYASKILSWTKIIDVETSWAATTATYDQREEYLNLMMKTLIECKARPDVFRIKNYRVQGLSTEFVALLRQLAPNFRIVHFRDIFREDLSSWIDALDFSRVVDLKLTFTYRWAEYEEAPVSASDIILKILQESSEKKPLALKSLHVAFDATSSSFFEQLGQLHLPELENLSVECPSYIVPSVSTPKSFLGTSSEDTHSFRPKLKRLCVSSLAGKHPLALDFMTQRFGIDFSVSPAETAALIKKQTAVDVDEFYVDQLPIWANIIKNNWSLNDDGHLEEYFNMCYPPLEPHKLTESAVRERLSHFVILASALGLSMGTGRSRNHHKSSVKAKLKLIREKFYQVASDMPWVARSRALDAPRIDQHLQYPEEALHARIIECADIVGLRKMANSSWLKLKALWENRAHEFSLPLELPPTLMERFFAEPIEWWSHFDLNEAYNFALNGITSGGIWRRVDQEILTKLIACPNFDPNVDAPDGEILMKIYEKYPKLTPEAHTSIQHLLPKLNPDGASSSWFAREDVFIEDPKTRATFFDYILKHWQTFKPLVRLFPSAASFCLFTAHANATKQSISEEILVRSANALWRTVLSSCKTDDEFRTQATSLLEAVPSLPDFVKKIRAGEQAPGIIPRIGDDAATRILRELTPGSRCVIC